MTKIPAPIVRWIEKKWLRQWTDYPSQDNEGFQPNRCGYKCGFSDGAKSMYEIARAQAIKDVIDACEEEIGYGVNKHHVSHLRTCFAEDLTELEKLEELK